MRNSILKQYLTIPSDAIIIGQSGSVHIKSFFGTTFILGILWIAYNISIYFMPSLSLLKRSFGIAGLSLYIYFMIDFLNKYLDAIVIGKQGVSVFKREGVLTYRIQQFERDNIETVSYSQDTLSDRLFSKGALKISLERGETFPFYDIPSPHHVVNDIRNYKNKYSNENLKQPEALGGEQHGSNEKFEILVETLGEVIKEYMGRTETKEHKKRDM